MLHRKHLALLLSLLMLVALLCACGTGNTEQTTTAADGTSSVSETAATEPISTPLDIIKDGKAIFKVIRDEDADSGDIEITMSRRIIDTVAELTGATMQLGTDWIKRGTEYDATTYEILVGNTDYPQTQEVMKTLKYGDWAVRMVDNKIVVFGYNNQTLSEATSALISIIRDNISEDKKSVFLAAEKLPLDQVGTTEGQLSALPIYEGGKFGAYYEACGDCDEIIVSDTTIDEYRAYLTKLESAGFKCYTTHDIAENTFATYTNDMYTLNVGYYDYEKSARLLIEPLAPAVGLEAENKYTPITTSQITALGQGYTAGNGDYKGNGLSILIRLTDGRFIVVDGGHNLAASADNLLKELRAQSKDYAKNDSEITIAAWIVTHAHGDHYGALLGHGSKFRNINVERFMINYLSENERTRARNVYSDNWSGNDGNNGYPNTLAMARTLGAEVHHVRVGQVYYLADLELEVLYTIDSFAPKACNAMNTTSLVMRMEFGGKDGTVYMSTGDATGQGMDICAKMYGDYLQSDIVQVCHHGYSTWGNDNGVIKAYERINAPTVLWPQGSKAFPNYKGKVYNAVLFTVSNYKECYVSGELGESIVLPIPYTVGTGIENR